MFGAQEWSADNEESPAAYARRLFVRYFDLEVKKQLLGKDEDEKRWKGRKPPCPMDIKSLVGGGSEAHKQQQLLSVVEHNVPSDADSAKAFLRAVEKVITVKGDSIGELTFDKDDEVSALFCVACVVGDVLFFRSQWSL